MIAATTAANARTSATDTRRDAILLAAFEVFRLYGYRRTAMEDIARASGMSRAALYSHFRNKEDVFRTLLQAYFTRMASYLDAALTPGLPPAQAMDVVSAIKTGPEMRALMDSPHGAELLDAHLSQCADLIDSGEARFVTLLADWLRSEAEAGRVALRPDSADAEGVARTIIAALHGLKRPGIDYGEFVADVQRLSALFGHALTPAPTPGP